MSTLRPLRTILTALAAVSALAGCSKPPPATHALVGHVVRDFDYADDGHWGGGKHAGPVLGMSTQLRSDRLAEVGGFPESAFGLTLPHAEVWLNVATADNDAFWTRNHPDIPVGSEGGLAGLESSSDRAPKRTRFFRLPAPYDGYIWCSVICELTLKVDGMSTSMQIARPGIANWQVLADGWTRVVRRQVSAA